MKEIPLCKPSLNKKELGAIKKVLDSGWLTDGPMNREFEEKFACYIGTKYAISLNSCTSALFLALKVLGITGEVIIPSFTFVATANAIVTAGATPVFADVNYDTGNIDPASIEAAITPRTEAIMPVHFAGQSCQMDKILTICQKHKLALIEDSAETIGGTFKKRKTGSFGLGCFSFFPTKNITTGEGGMITTNDSMLDRKIRTLMAHGIDKKDKTPARWYRAAKVAVYNFRLSNILAALGVEQLKKLDKMNTLRRKHAKYFNQQLANLPIELPVEDKLCKHVYQMYTIKVRGNRNKIVQELNDRGIRASVHFDPPVHQQSFYVKNFPTPKNRLPNTEKIAHLIITLPMYPSMTKKDLYYMTNTLAEILTNIGLTHL